MDTAAVQVVAQKLKEMEASKVRLIDSYMRLQDEADELNGRIFHLCCEIETLNRQIAAVKKSIPLNGKAATPPSPGATPSPA